MVKMLLGKKKLCSGYSLDYKINLFSFFWSHYTIQHCPTAKHSPDHLKLIVIAFTWQSMHRRKAAELHQDAFHCSVSWGKVTVEGSFYWSVLLESCAGHAIHPSSYCGNRTAQHELHVLLGYLSLFVGTLYIPNMSRRAGCQVVLQMALESCSHNNKNLLRNVKSFLKNAGGGKASVRRLWGWVPSASFQGKSCVPSPLSVPFLCTGLTLSLCSFWRLCVWLQK